MPYYEAFTSKYPNVFDLAAESEDEILKLWQGLGYYSRARNMHHTAKEIVRRYKGVFPGSGRELRQLKGIGDYTSAAIASICFGESAAVLDGNVFRVLARYLGIDTPINSTEGKKIFKEKANHLLDVRNPGNYNQAIMEFGALHCKPVNPLCETCPLKNDCVAFQNGLTEKLPVKINNVRVKTRHMNYMVFILAGNKTIIRRRTRGIWKKLYEFPLIETSKEVGIAQLKNHKDFPFAANNSAEVTSFYEKEIMHRLTHQLLKIKFWIVEVSEIPQSLTADSNLITDWSEIEKYAVPVVIDKFLEDYRLTH